MSPHKHHHNRPKRPRTPPPKSDSPTAQTTFLGRDGLGAYIADPTAFPASRVIYHTDNFVAINDLFPKSTIHCLLLPRDPAKTRLHPLDAFEDPVFLAEVKAETAKLKTLAAKELKRRVGMHSQLEQAREKAMDDEMAGTWPEGRDWEREIVAGVHAGPSMSHLHVHVLSVDRRSVCMKHGKHYNSFATPFLVGLEEMPLSQEDERRTHGGKLELLERELRCWRCGKGIKRGSGRGFQKLKEHLEGEFEIWRAI